MLKTFIYTMAIISLNFTNLLATEVASNHTISDSCSRMDKDIILCKPSECKMNYNYQKDGEITYKVVGRVDENKCHYISVINFIDSGKNNYFVTDCKLSSKGRSVIAQDFLAHRDGFVPIDSELAGIIKNECNIKN